MLHHLLSQPRLRSIVVEAAIALAVFWSDPLGLAEQEHRAIDANVALFTQYQRLKPPNDLAVVIIDKPALLDWRVDWPINYEKTADLIHSLACSNVRGVFFDWSLSRQFDLAKGENELRDAIENSSNVGIDCPKGGRPAKIPVFFGKIDGVETRLGDWLDKREGAFLLNPGEADSIYQTGREKFPVQPPPPGEVTPAFGIMRNIPGWNDEILKHGPCADADPRPQCWRAPLTLVWSGRIDPVQGDVSRTLGCRSERGLLDLFIAATPIGSDERLETCRPVLTLRALDLERDLAYIEKFGDPSDKLAGRFVFVGVDIPGLNDRIESPVHGFIPGVYKHAVALGALLHYRDNYPTIPKQSTLVLLAGFIYLALETLREFTRARAHRHWLFLGGFVLSVLALGAFVFWRGWPASVVVSIFGYYAAVVSALFVSAWARGGKLTPARKLIGAKGNHGGHTP